MCQSIFSFLGENPSVESWPDLSSIPFVPTVSIELAVPLHDRLRRLIPEECCSDEGLDLLCRLLQLVPEKRASVEEVCSDSYFSDCIYESVLKGEYGRDDKRCRE